MSDRLHNIKTQLAGRCGPACLLLVLCLISTAGVAQEPAGDAAGDLVARFRDQAIEQLSFGRARSEPLPPTAKRALLEFIDGGVLQLNEAGATPERIELAGTNLRAFMARLVAVSRTAPGRRIDKASIETVRAEMCPLYPFC